MKTTSYVAASLATLVCFPAKSSMLSSNKLRAVYCEPEVVEKAGVTQRIRVEEYSSVMRTLIETNLIKVEAAITFACAQ